MLNNILLFLLGAYVPAATVFGFMFILGGGKSNSLTDALLSVLFIPGIFIAFGFLTLIDLFKKV